MAKPAFIKLGGGEAKTFGIGPKAALLDQAAAAGLPVPFGVVLLDESISSLTAAGYVAFKHQQYFIQDLPLLFASLRLPHFERPVAIRAAFTAPDATDEFPAVLDVDTHKSPLFGEAIREIWNSSAKHAGRFRRDLLILEMIDARHSGVAFTQAAHEDDAWLGVDSPITEARSLPKLRHRERPTGTDLASRLQKLLRDVRREFGDGDWELEWADDGKTCWLLRLRPLANALPRNERFTAAALSELLPPLPSRLAASLAAACGDGLVTRLREFDPDVPPARPLVEIFLGRPFFNLSLLTETARRIGLSTRSLTPAVGATDDPVPASKGRLLRHLPVIKRLLNAQFKASASARARIGEFDAVSRAAGESFADCIEALTAIQVGLVAETVALNAFISGPVAVLRKFEVLAEFIDRRHREATRMQTDLEPLAAIVRERPEFVGLLRRGELPDDRTFREAWQRFLDAHGHRGIFECDIARPRYHEHPEPILDALLALPEPPKRRWLPSLKAMPLLPVWWPTSRAMRLREDLRDQALRHLDRIREKMVRLAETAVLRGQLPDRDKLWLLDVAEIRRLDDGTWRPQRKFFQEREAEQAAFAEYDLPARFNRFDDLETFRMDRSDSLSPRGLDDLALEDDSRPPVADESPFVISHPSFSSGRRAS